MASSFTTGKGDLEKPANGDFVDNWNTPINADMDSIDACLSGTTPVTLANPSVNINLSQAQMKAARIVVFGTLTQNVQISFIAGISAPYAVTNATTGSFTLSFGTTIAGATVSVPTGKSAQVYSDGTNVVPSDDGGILNVVSVYLPPGAISDFAMAGAPTGWLVCDGSAVSRTTYLALFTNIGTTWGVGNGSTTFNIPNFQGRFRRTWDQSGTVDPARAFASLQADAFKTHTHGTNETPHTHTVPVVAGVNQAGFNNSSPIAGGGASVTTSGNTTGLTIQNTGDTETRPTNYAVLTCIKT